MNDHAPIVLRTLDRGPWAERHPVLVDLLLLAPYVAVVLGMTVIDAGLRRLDLDVLIERAALTLVVLAAVRCRRRGPGTVMAAALAAQVVAILLGHVGEPWSPLVLVASVASRRRARDGALVAAAVVVTVIMGLILTQVGWPSSVAAARQLVVDPALYAIGASISLVVGTVLGARRRYIAEILQRTDELAAERDRSAALARVAERTRIARDMHDVLSHGLQVIVSAGDSALVTLEDDPARTRQLLTTVTSAGRQSMAEARMVFTLLHSDDGEDTHPQPDLTDLPGLVDRLRGAGLSVGVAHQGVPPDDIPRRSTVVRIVQEALTNSLRHGGPGTHAEVVIDHSALLTTVDVTDDGAGRATPSPGSRNGLEGMRQRAALFAGVVSAGPREDAEGWQVRAVLPHRRGSGA